MAFFQLEGSSNGETKLERVRFSEKECGCSYCYKCKPVPTLVIEFYKEGKT